MSDQYKITEEQKKQLLQISAQTLPDNPSREGYSAEQIRGRLYKPYAALIDMINGVFGTAYTDVSDMQTALQNGDIFSRGFVGWNPTYTYGAGEVTFYPDIGTYGAFVKSSQAGNTNHAPYTDGTVNSAWWSEVVNFNTVTDDFFAEIKAVQTAAEAAQSAAETAQGKAEDAQAAAEEAESGAQTQAQAAASSATAAEESADAAESAKVAAQTAQNEAESAAENALAYAEQASSSAGDAAQSASAAAASANRAQEIVNGIGSVYKPVGSIAFSALPSTPTAAQQGYVYNVTDAFTTDARFVEGAGKEYPAGTNVAVVLNGSAYMYDALSGNVDLSNYAQKNGTYPNMTVGEASNAENAEKASQDAAGNDISATYAKQTGTYPNMSVGTASEAAYADAAASADTAGYATTAKGDASGNDIGATYAKQTGTYAGMTVGNATHADSATKATQDGNGNSISATYATASEVSDLETQIAGKYTKPSTGIPESDLSEAVQTKLNSGGGAGSLYLHRVCLPLSAATTVSDDIAIFTIYLSSPTPFTIETFFEWLIGHFAGVPESYFDYPALPAFSCVSTYSKGDSSGQSMYPAILTYIVDDSENQGEPAYDIKISGEELMEGPFILSQVKEGTFIDTVTEV